MIYIDLYTNSKCNVCIPYEEKIKDLCQDNELVFNSYDINGDLEQIIKIIEGLAIARKNNANIKALPFINISDDIGYYTSYEGIIDDIETILTPKTN